MRTYFAKLVTLGIFLILFYFKYVLILYSKQTQNAAFRQEPSSWDTIKAVVDKINSSPNSSAAFSSANCTLNGHSFTNLCDFKIIKQIQQSVRFKELNQSASFNTLFQNYMHSGDFEGKIESKIKENISATKKIVIYTETVTNIKPKCRYFRCKFLQTSDIKHHLKIADAIVFQGTNLPLIPQQRGHPDQIFVTKTNTFYNLPDAYKYGYFDWIMSYQKDSDIPLPQTLLVPKEHARSFILEGEMTGIYGDVRHHSHYIKHWYIHHFSKLGEPKRKTGQPVALGLPGKNYSSIFTAKHPNVSTVRTSSSCFSSKVKNLYLTTLEETVYMDVLGPCQNQTCSPRDVTCIATTYKFYFVSDISCNMRISNFLLKLYTANIVLVAHGSEKYSNIFPNGTYIDSRHFESASHLANYLNELSRDESKYLEILRSKDMFIQVPSTDIINTAYCRLCYMLNRLTLFQKERIKNNQWLKAKQCHTAS